MIEKGIDFALNVASPIFTASGERTRPKALTIFLASAEIWGLPKIGYPNITPQIV